MSQKYYYTIKNIRQGERIGPSELQVYEDHMLKVFKGTKLYSYFEHDSLLRNHIHGVFTARKGIRYSLCKIDYVHFDIGRLDTFCDEETWHDYIRKENWDLIEQKYQELWYKQNYGFICDDCRTKEVSI